MYLYMYIQIMFDPYIAEHDCMHGLTTCSRCGVTFWVSAWGNLANILNTQGKVLEAEQAYRSALQHRPNMADVHYNL